MAKKKKLSVEDEKKLLLLKSTYEMHAKTREEVKLRGKNESLERMDLILADTYMSMADIDESFAKKVVKENTFNGETDLTTKVLNANQDNGGLFEALEKLDIKEGKFDVVEDQSQDDTALFYSQVADEEVNLYDLADNMGVEIGNVTTSNEESTGIYNDVDPNAQYDVIKLPSKGQCYRNKVDRLPVGYLTAADENLITSPNLYESGEITNILLKKKVLNKDFNVDNLVSGDADAIMVFLRGTSYGNEFPIVVTDPRTGKSFETTTDLSKLNYKPFNLQADENGLFDFELPLTKMKIKFKFLTKKEMKLLKKVNEKEAQGIAAFDLADAIEKIKTALKTDQTLSDGDKNLIIDANNKLQKWCDALNSNKNTTPYSKGITNTMEMQIVSINGNSDKKFIHAAVMAMPASDSLAFRRYVFDNEPGVNFEIEVKRPESDGGGSFKTFLEWDDYVFWHIA